jgi:hypothetical protein
MTAINNITFSFFMIFSFWNRNSYCLTDETIRMKDLLVVRISKYEERELEEVRLFLRDKLLKRLFHRSQKVEMKDWVQTTSTQLRRDDRFWTMPGLASESA